MLHTLRARRRLLAALAATSLAATTMAAGSSGAAAAGGVFSASGVTTVGFQAGHGISFSTSNCPVAVGQLSAELVANWSSNGVSYNGPVHVSAVFTSEAVFWSCGGLVIVGDLTQASFQGSDALGNTFSCDTSQGGYASLPLLDGVFGWWGLYLGNCVIDGASVGPPPGGPNYGFGDGAVTGVDSTDNQVTEVVVAGIGLNYPAVH